MNSNERFYATLRGEPVDHAPIFPLLMFFAADRAGLPFRRYATDGLALAEAQVAMRERFGLDAITACSDSFRVSADLGGTMSYPEDKTPFLTEPVVRGKDDLARLERLDPTRPGSRMADRLAAITAMSQAVQGACPVVGWVEMPFAEACDLVGVSDFMMMMIDEPETAHAVLEAALRIEIDFALAQLAAGAPMIGAGDAAASLISPRNYREFALPYEKRLVEAVHAAGGLVKLHICGNTTALLPDMATCGADLFNVDHMVPFERAVAVYGAAHVAYKGNLDPVADMLQATPEECQRRTLECLRLAEGTRYMLSAGCEVPAGASDEVLAAFCGAAGLYAAERRG
jgi:MtaA/CmuA family methyltransferase